MTEMKTRLSENQLLSRFMQRQQEGAQRFGLHWIVVNEAARDGLLALGVNESKSLAKTLASEIAFRICVRLEQSNRLNKEASDGEEKSAAHVGEGESTA